MYTCATTLRSATRRRMKMETSSAARRAMMELLWSRLRRWQDSMTVNRTSPHMDALFCSRAMTNSRRRFWLGFSLGSVSCSHGQARDALLSNHSDSTTSRSSEDSRTSAVSTVTICQMQGRTPSKPRSTVRVKQLVEHWQGESGKPFDEMKVDKKGNFAEPDDWNLGGVPEAPLEKRKTRSQAKADVQSLPSDVIKDEIKGEEEEKSTPAAGKAKAKKSKTKTKAKTKAELELEAKRFEKMPASIDDYHRGDLLVAYDSMGVFWVVEVMDNIDGELKGWCHNPVDASLPLNQQKWSKAWSNGKKIKNTNKDQSKLGWKAWTWDNIGFEEIRSKPFPKLTYNKLPESLEIWGGPLPGSVAKSGWQLNAILSKETDTTESSFPKALPKVETHSLKELNKKRNTASYPGVKGLAMTLLAISAPYDKAQRLSQVVVKLAKNVNDLATEAQKTLQKAQQKLVHVKPDDMARVLRTFVATTRAVSIVMLEYVKISESWRKEILKSEDRVLKLYFKKQLDDVTLLKKKYEQRLNAYLTSAEDVCEQGKEFCKRNGVPGYDKHFKTNHEFLGDKYRLMSLREELTSRAAFTPDAPTLELPDVMADKIPVPLTAKQAAASKEYGAHWKLATALEVHSLITSETWVEVDSVPRGRKAIDIKWVYKAKAEDGTGKVSRFKARLVVKGYLQKYGVDFWETYAPTLSYPLLKLTLLWAMVNDLPVHHIDVETAFLESKLPEDQQVYVKLPEGTLPGRRTVFVKLKKGLYGLKQAPRLWYKEFTSTLKELGFTEVEDAPCLFIRRNKTGPPTLLALFVDDSVLAASQAIKEEIVIALKKKYKIKDMGQPKQILGLVTEWNEDRTELFIHQKPYIQQVINTYMPNGCGENKTPAEHGLVPTPADFAQPGDDTVKDKDFPDGTKNFRSVFGSLMHVTKTRTDIITALNMAGRCSHNPGMGAVRMLKRIIRYLFATLGWGQHFKKDDCKFENYADADFAADIITRRSRSGGVCIFGGAALIHYSRLQSCVSLSTTEAEVNALVIFVRELIPLFTALVELGLAKPSDKIIVNEDNTGAIYTCTNHQVNRRNKHYQIKWKWLSELYDDKKLDLISCSTHVMKADGLTKNLGPTKFLSWRASVGITAPPAFVLHKYLQADAASALSHS